MQCQMKLAILIAAILLPRLSIMACARACQTLTIYGAWHSKACERDMNVWQGVRRCAIHVACLGEMGEDALYACFCIRVRRVERLLHGRSYPKNLTSCVFNSLLWVLQHPAQIQTPTKSRDRRRRRHSYRLGHGSGHHMYMARDSDTAKDTKADADRYTPAQR